MKVLILGSGGREHAIAQKIVDSSLSTEVFVAPGNAGTSSIATNLSVDVLDFTGIKKLLVDHQIELLVVGPEVPLVAGIHDFILNDAEIKNVKVIGPAKAAAQLEGSKEFAKAFMERNGIPTAKYRSFGPGELSEAFSFLEGMSSPYVLKADGLAAGKGVLIINDLNEAKGQLTQMLEGGKFGEASNKVVIEEFLNGIELSCFVLTDGKDYKILPYAKDYKRIGEGDTGLNTGGMGAISPVPFATDDFKEKVEKQVVIPTVNGLKKEGIPYQGFIFIGLMKVGDQPMVIEYNARMGDPETEVVFPRIKSDVLELLQATSNGNLESISIEVDDRFACTVMAVSGGYPESYEKGHLITGLNEVQGSMVYHAGTKPNNAEVLTNGGRVLAVTSMAKTINEALERSYANLKKIQFKDMNYRTDIGFDL